MSVLIFAVIAPLAATIDDAITERVERARMARKLPRRARQYKFN